MPRRRGPAVPAPSFGLDTRVTAAVHACAGGKARHVVRVTVLGSGDAFGSGGRLHSAYLVETPRHTFLLDCGPTILQAFKRSGRDPGAVDFVLLSHLHGDHFGGLPFLFMEYRFEEPRSRQLTVYGPPGTERRVRALFGALYERIASEPLPFAVRYEEVVAGTSPALDGVRVLPFVVPPASELRAVAWARRPPTARSTSAATSGISIASAGRAPRTSATASARRAASARPVSASR